MTVAWLARMPGVRAARGYQRAWLRGDLTAGVVLTALLIPAGMGYAQAAGLPSEAGLAATVVPLVVYALLGPSRLLVLGPDSSLVPMIATAVVPLAAGDSTRAITLAGLLAVMVGAILCLIAVARLGIVTDLLSRPIRLGYLAGVAVVVIVSQVPKLLGFSVESGRIWQVVGDIVAGVRDGEVVSEAATIGVACLVAILLLHAVWPRVPALLMAMLGAGVVVAALGWRDDLPVVGALPARLQLGGWSALRWGDVIDLAPAALVVALVSCVDTTVLSRVFAARRGEHVHPDSEIVAVGAANVAAGALGGFPISGSSSRTPAAEAAGAKSQLANVVAAMLVVVFWVAARGSTAYLPISVLAAVVIAAVLPLIDWRELRRLIAMERTDGVLAIIAFAGVIALGVLQESSWPSVARSSRSCGRPGAPTAPSSAASPGCGGITTCRGTPTPCAFPAR